MNPRTTLIYCTLGIVAAVLAWIVIGITWWLNSDWFVWTRDAYSDLGGPHSCCPWAYNYGLIAVGIIMIVFGTVAASVLPGKLGGIGGSHIALAGVFLILIGVFPSGTRPHTFVSTWFFIQADTALVISLLSVPKPRGRLVTSALIAALLAFPIAILVGLTIGWPSAAVLETYGILIIDYGVIALWHACSTLLTRSKEL